MPNAELFGRTYGVEVGGSWGWPSGWSALARMGAACELDVFGLTMPIDAASGIQCGSSSFHEVLRPCPSELIKPLNIRRKLTI
jgi:hypothetical protein